LQGRHAPADSWRSILRIPGSPPRTNSCPSGRPVRTPHCPKSARLTERLPSYCRAPGEIVRQIHPAHSHLHVSALGPRHTDSPSASTPADANRLLLVGALGGVTARGGSCACTSEAIKLVASNRKWKRKLLVRCTVPRFAYAA